MLANALEETQIGQQVAGNGVAAAQSDIDNSVLCKVSASCSQAGYPME